MGAVVFNDKRLQFIGYYEAQSRKLQCGAKTAIRPFNCLVSCYNSYGPNRQHHIMFYTGVYIFLVWKSWWEWGATRVGFLRVEVEMTGHASISDNYTLGERTHSILWPFCKKIFSHDNVSCLAQIKTRPTTRLLWLHITYYCCIKECALLYLHFARHLGARK